MRFYEKAILGLLAALVATAGLAALFTRSWANYRAQFRAQWVARHSSVVDTQPLTTAEQLAQIAVTPAEREYAAEAVHLADHSVDLAFADALADAAEHPTPLTPETRALAARIKALEDAIAADQARADALQKQLARASAASQAELQEKLSIAQAQMSLDQDDLADAHQDLMRSGGDRQATIQQLLEQHEASEVHTANAQGGAPAGLGTQQGNSIELTKSGSLVAQCEAWLSLHQKQAQLAQAGSSALGRASSLTADHEALEKKLGEEKSRQQILHRSSPGPSAEARSVAPQVSVSAPPSQIPARAAAPAPEPAQPPAPSAGQTKLALLRHLNADQKRLSQFDARIETEQQLATSYGNWAALVSARAKAFAHELLVSCFWIALIGFLTIVANRWVQGIFRGMRLERRQLHTARAIALFAVQAAGVVLILLVIFGVPSNLPTVLALGGAGLTVAMKDFIVGFVGWFVLMGKNGIHPGDWVEINGVSGEVLEVGLLHTVVLETGNWTDAGHPTGRKVSFVNSFAIEGHYFNFSTSGQWLWDEIQIQVPTGAEPYATAEAIQAIVTAETAASARLAEEEWNRVTPVHMRHGFSAVPALSIRPTASGMTVLVRYITRANERHHVRAQLYRAIVDVLRSPAKLAGPRPSFASPETA